MSNNAHYSMPAPPDGLLEGAHRVRIEMPDMDGLLRGKYIDPAKFRAGAGPIMFTEAYLSLTVGEELAATGIGSPETGYGDMIAAPDWSTARRLPWNSGVISVLCDGLNKDGTDHLAHPRTVLKRVVETAAQDGFESTFGVEFEFWAFRLDENSRLALAEGRMHDLTPSSRLPQTYSLARWPDCSDFFDDLVASMDAYGIPIETVMTEMGVGMLEAALGPASALEAADRAARFKLAAREIAAKHGLLLSFIAKLRSGDSGSSGHVHQSLQRDGENVFWGGQRETLSETGKQYLAGLLRATRDCGVFMAPYPNSYRRFDPEFFAPNASTWAWDNRHACVRAIAPTQKSARLELRRPGADMQPYLTIAASLAGGLHGIRAGWDAPPEVGGTGQAHPELVLATELADAITVLHDSELARNMLGDDIVDAYVALREAELAAWEGLQNAEVPEWELRRYLEVV